MGKPDPAVSNVGRPPAGAADSAGREGVAGPGDDGVSPLRRQERTPRLPAQLLLVGTGLALFLLGAVLGVVGSFLNGTAPRVLGVGVPVGVLLAVVGNVAAGLLGTRGTGSRLGGALPCVAWFTVVLLFGNLRSEGDLIVTGNGHGVAFIVLGAVAACLGLLPGGGRRTGPRSGR